MMTPKRGKLPVTLPHATGLTPGPQEQARVLSGNLGGNGHIAEGIEIPIFCAHTDIVPIEKVIPNPLNPNKHPDKQIQLLAKIIAGQGWRTPITISKRSGYVVRGHARLTAAQLLDLQTVPVDYQEYKTEAEEYADLVADNRIAELAVVDLPMLKDILQIIDTGALDMAITGFTSEELENLMTQFHVNGDGQTPEQANRTLAERFIVPPFSVLDARQGYWQERKRAWLALGIQSELGRGDGVTCAPSDAMLDPTLNHYRNMNAAPGGSLRPAAKLGADGHTVRGDGKGQPIKGLARTFGQDLMKGENPNFGGSGEASKAFKSQGRLAALQKTGNSRLTWVAGDRPPEQLDEVSRKNLAAQPQSGTSIFDPVLCELAYRWFCPPQGRILDPFAGGSVRGIVAGYLGYNYTGVELRAEQVVANEEQAAKIVPDNKPKWIVGDSQQVKHLTPGEYDLLFSCPPYYDLEVYSDRPGELSAMPPEAFKEAYQHIIADSCSMLKDNRFAVWVVGDVRDKKGYYRHFVADTIAAFAEAGLQFYNDAVLVTAVGSLPIRVIRQFEAGRKLGKTHQNVLIFVKGDAKKAVEACGPVKVEWEPEAEEAVKLA